MARSPGKTSQRNRPRVPRRASGGKPLARRKTAVPAPPPPLGCPHGRHAGDRGRRMLVSWPRGVVLDRFNGIHDFGGGKYLARSVPAYRSRRHAVLPAAGHFPATKLGASRSPGTWPVVCPIPKPPSHHPARGRALPRDDTGASRSPGAWPVVCPRQSRHGATRPHMASTWPPHGPPHGRRASSAPGLLRAVGLSCGGSPRGHRAPFGTRVAVMTVAAPRPRT